MSALLQSVAEMQGGTGRLYVSIGTAKPAYFHNGIPYDAERRVCVENGAVHHYHQGLGYSVNSRLCRLSVDPDYFGNGAAPFSLADPAKLCDGGGLTHYNSGVGYSSVGRLSIVNSAPPDPFIWAGTVGVGTDNAGFYGFQTALYGDIAPPDIDGININYLRAAVNLTIQLRMAGDVGIPEVDTNSINIYFEGYSLAPTVLNWTTNRYVSAIDEALYDFVASRLGSNINFKMEEILPP